MGCVAGQNGEHRLSVVRHHNTPERQQLLVHLLQREDPGLWDGLQLWILFLTASTLYLAILRSALFLSQFYIRPGWLLCNADSVCWGVQWGEEMVQNLLSQFLEALQQTPRGPALFSSQWHHEEVEVVKQGHMIIVVRLCYLEQLSPTVLHAHTWHTHQNKHTNIARRQ